MLIWRREKFAKWLDGLTEDQTGEFQRFAVRFLKNVERQVSDAAFYIPNPLKKDKGEDAYGVFSDGRAFSVACSLCDKDHLKGKVREDCREIQKNRAPHLPAVVYFLTRQEVSGTTKDELEAIARAFRFELEVRDREWFLLHATEDRQWHDICRELRLPGQGYTVLKNYDRQAIEDLLEYNPLLVPGQPLIRPELRGFQWNGRSLLVVGKPGAGKTTTLVGILDQRKPSTIIVVDATFGRESVQEMTGEDYAGEVCLVFDNVQARPGLFRDACLQVHARLKDRLNVLATSRWPDWEDCLPEVGDAAIEAIRLPAEPLRLEDLSTEACATFLDHCARELGITIPEDLRQRMVEVCTRADATPLYIVSVLAPILERPERTVRIADITDLPENVTDLWRRRFDRLWTTTEGQIEQNLLRTLKMTLLIFERSPLNLPEAASAFMYGLSQSDVENGLERLERRLWLRRGTGGLRMYDTQREAIQVRDNDWERWDRFVHNGPHPVGRQFALHYETGWHYLQVRAAGAATSEVLMVTLKAATTHFVRARESRDRARDTRQFANCLLAEGFCLARLASLASDRTAAQQMRATALEKTLEAISLQRTALDNTGLASSLINASDLYSEQAATAENFQQHYDLLDKAVAASEEAIALHRRFAVPADLAASLNNASTHYSEQAAAVEDPQQRRDLLDKAVAASEESINLRRKLALPAHLALSLNNASNRYSEQAATVEDFQQRRDLLDRAVAAIEEAIELRRKLARPADLATSLHNASNRYSEQAAAVEDLQQRRDLLDRAAAAIEGAIELRRRLAFPVLLAGSLHNASLRYAQVAMLESLSLRKQAHLVRACSAIDEAITLLLNLGHTQRLLTALPIGVQRHLDAARLTQDISHLSAAVQYANIGIDMFVEFGKRVEAIRYAKRFLDWFRVVEKQDPKSGLQALLAKLENLVQGE